jgi:hypothetical protein
MRVHIARNDPKALAELIESTLQGRAAPTTSTRSEPATAERPRISPHDADTVDFKRIDDNDWSDV